MRYPQGHGRSHVSDNARPLEVCWGSGGTDSGYAFVLVFLSVSRTQTPGGTAQRHPAVRALDAAVVDACCGMSLHLLRSWP